MRYSKCYSFFLLLFLVAALAVSSCKKIDGTDNTKVIRTPYAVFFGKKSGEITKTNDGLLYKDLFPADGVGARAITTSADNIIFIKTVLRYSSDNGKAFNQPVPGQPVPSVSPVAKWASMILDVPGSRVYVASTTGTGGIEISDDNGKTWRSEDTWPNTLSGTVSSFTQTADGRIFALDATGGSVFVKPTNNAQWSAVTVTTGLPTGTQWYLSSYNNSIIAADYKGTGIYHSDNGGTTWDAYTGIPGNQEILSCNAPLNQVLLVGTDSSGIYRYNGTGFEQSNNGLQPFTSVYGIVGKQDTYKNGIIKRYVYISTNYGLYRSEDLGKNWVLMYPGNLRAIW